MKETEKMVRINSRITSKHDKYIKAKAKKLKVSEGEALRDIIDQHIAMHKKV